MLAAAGWLQQAGPLPGSARTLVRRPPACLPGRAPTTPKKQQVAREIAIACEDLVTGTVRAVDAGGVTVAYALEDGSEVTVRGAVGGGWGAAGVCAATTVWLAELLAGWLAVRVHAAAA